MLLILRGPSLLKIALLTAICLKKNKDEPKDIHALFY